ncbi:8163_t:CDS:2 [Diversispora eburnea]|uniref:8163_t:CDS:1 n=1 Tax=Diversispora eburnea TaxID=1213867 RepID=A0A9N8YWA1_9GLOM|nr:8163_t:CDS:2 [Diversispora eburnea]
MSSSSPSPIKSFKSSSSIFEFRHNSDNQQDWEIGKDNERVNPLFKSLALICNNILNMDLKIKSHSYYRLQLLEKLISTQKRLENLSIIDNSFLGHDDSNSILWAIIKLYIEDFYGLSKSDSIFFASSFTQLNIFHYFYSSYQSGLEANKLLYQMAENVPESLETIEIKIRKFSSDSLRKFFDGWCCKGVIEEYGVQFDIEE